MIRLLSMLVLLLPVNAAAQDTFPALYDVAGVAANDVLNVRAEPSAQSEVIGAFAPLETGVEVIALSDDGSWGRVNIGEQAGWAAMRFLARQPGQSAVDWSAGLAPMTLACFGTEPFWGLALMPDETFEFTDPFQGDGTPMSGPYTPLAPSASSVKRGFVGTMSGSPNTLTGLITREICSDGMSDQVYGFALDLIRSDPSGNRLDAGCCRLVP